MKENVECNSGDMKLRDNLDNSSQCAAHCRAKDGCNFFVFGRTDITTNGAKGQCWWEKTSDASCPEGFESDTKYHFYELLDLGKNKKFIKMRRSI